LTRFVALVLLVVGAACGRSSSGNPAVTNYHDPQRVFNAIEEPGLACANRPKVVTATRGADAEVGVCGPIGSVPKSLLIVAVYRSGLDARNAFRAHCDSGSWNLYRNGQNWRGSLDAEGFRVPSDIADEVANALGTDAFRGCGEP
jgi:hypothetical protein